MQQLDQIYKFRPYKREDLNLIQSSWGHSYRKECQRFRDIDPAEFHALHRPIREEALKRPTVAIIVCAAKDDEDTIIGWIAVEKPKKRPGMILHYIYVKKVFEGNGIASELMKMALIERPVYYTQATPHWYRMIDENHNKFHDFTFEPELIRGEDHT